MGKDFRAFLIIYSSCLPSLNDTPNGPIIKKLGQEWVRNQKLQKEKSVLPILKEELGLGGVMQGKGIH